MKGLKIRPSAVIFGKRLLVGVAVGALTLLATPVAAQGASTEDGIAGAPRLIEIEALALAFVQGGEPVLDIPVTPGETVLIRVNNSAGVKHNFFIGTDEELAVAFGATDVGIEDWIRRPPSDRVQEVRWTVPVDISGLKFGCTILGHYDAMQGTFSLAGGSGDTPVPGQPPGSALEIALGMPKCDPADADVSTCWSEALTATRALFDAEYHSLIADQNDAWRAGDDPVPSALAVAQWADDFVVAVERIGLAEALPAEMEAFAAAHAAFAQYTRDDAEVVMSQRDDAVVVQHIQARQKALIALTRALAPS